jgi:hypothetical protein
MKALITLCVAVAMLASSTVQAQQSGSTGRGAVNGTNSGSSSFAWGMGLGGLAIIGTVVGVVAATASSSPSTFSH